MCSREIYGTLFHILFPGSGAIEKSDPVSLSLGILNIMLPRIVLIHVCLSPINRFLVEVIKIFIYLFDEKWERKKRSPLGMKSGSILCTSFHRKEGVELMYWLIGSVGTDGARTRSFRLDRAVLWPIELQSQGNKGYIRKLDSFLFLCIRYFWRARVYTISW